MLWLGRKDNKELPHYHSFFLTTIGILKGLLICRQYTLKWKMIAGIVVGRYTAFEYVYKDNVVNIHRWCHTGFFICNIIFNVVNVRAPQLYDSIFAAVRYIKNGLSNEIIWWLTRMKISTVMDKARVFVLEITAFKYSWVNFSLSESWRTRFINRKRWRL